MPAEYKTPMGAQRGEGPVLTCVPVEQCVNYTRVFPCSQAAARPPPLLQVSIA